MAAISINALVHSGMSSTSIGCALGAVIALSNLIYVQTGVVRPLIGLQRAALIKDLIQ